MEVGEARPCCNLAQEAEHSAGQGAAGRRGSEVHHRDWEHRIGLVEHRKAIVDREEHRKATAGQVELRKEIVDREGRRTAIEREEERHTETGVGERHMETGREEHRMEIELAAGHRMGIEMEEAVGRTETELEGVGRHTETQLEDQMGEEDRTAVAGSEGLRCRSKSRIHHFLCRSEQCPSACHPRR